MTGERSRNADLFHQIRALGIAATVLYVGAHPDDEEAGLIAYLCRGCGARVVYWSATRGEGGQNRAGPERDEALGIIRTWESLAAREVDGGEVMYGPFYDFGYVKSAAAAMAAWGREELVGEIVRAIRVVRPDVVVSRWLGGDGDSHGHHQAVGWATVEAFERSGHPWSGLDPHAYPPWEARKLYHSLSGDWQPGEDWTGGRRNLEHERNGCLRVNFGELDPVAGRSYEELASIGRNCHYSQGLAFVPERGDYFSYYRLVQTRLPATGSDDRLLDGFDTSLAGLADRVDGSAQLRRTLEEATHRVTAALSDFRPDQPWEAGRGLLDAVDALRQARDCAAAAGLDAAGRGVLASIDRKLAAAAQVAARCLGIEVDCVVDGRSVTPGRSVGLKATLAMRGPDQATNATLIVRAPDGWIATPVGRPTPVLADSGNERRAEVRVGAPREAPFTCPYWLRQPRQRYRYWWPDEAFVGDPFEPPSIVAVWEFDVRSRRLSLAVPAVFRETRVGGYRELTLSVVPPVTLRPRRRREYVPMSVEPVGIQVEVGLEALHADLQQGVISLSAPDGWIVKPPSVEVTGLRAGHRHAVAFDVTVPPGCRDDVYQLGCQVSVGDGEYGVALQPIRQQAAGVKAADDGSSFVTETFLVAPASVAVHVIDASFVRTLRYGYISGADEGVVDTLSRFGVRIDEVSEHQLAYSDLSEFDAVVIGPNAYVVRDDVRQSAGRLLDYVEKGGTLIVQYQSYPFEVGGFAPYPFRFRHPHDRVTLPDSPVYILDADHPVIVGANKIGAADFDDWVHDRGLYFWGEWDRRYVPVLSSHDPGEDAKGGGLLAAEYGRGTYVYAAYSFFRQVPAGVPGAIRLFANLLGLAEAKVRHRIELVKSLSLFSWMTEAEIYDVARVMSQQIWDAGSYLCRQGDHSTDLFIVVAGHVEVVKEDAEGERVLYIAAAGEAIGELAMLAETARSASLRSQDDVTALVMRSRDFEALINQRPEMAGAFVRMLARRLAAAAES